MKLVAKGVDRAGVALRGTVDILSSSPHADRAWKTHRRAIKAAIHPKARDALKGEAGATLYSVASFYRPAGRESCIDRISVGITFDIFMESNARLGGKNKKK